MARKPRRTVSPERKGLYQVGLALQVLGGIGIVVCFILFATTGMAAVESMGQSTSPFGPFLGFIVSMVLVGVGGGVRSVAARGVAGSGLVLDPERAREDLEPWARMGGGLVQDAIDETDLKATLGGSTSTPPQPAEQVIKVRCRSCGALNDEAAKFCDQCGAEL